MGSIPIARSNFPDNVQSQPPGTGRCVAWFPPHREVVIAMPFQRRTLLAGMFGLGMARPAMAQGSALAAALLQFEEAVTWEAVSAEWRGIRPGWVQHVSGAAAPREIAGLMAILETHMGWHAVEPRWRARRDSWLAEAQAAATPAQVAALLLELEEVTLWSAVDASWRVTRPGWVAGLQAITAQKPRK